MNLRNRVMAASAMMVGLTGIGIYPRVAETNTNGFTTLYDPEKGSSGSRTTKRNSRKLKQKRKMTKRSRRINR